MELSKSNVIFDQEAHTYELCGVPLSGITSVITRHLFPRKYDNVPKYILDNAAQRGSFIHEQIELADSLGIVPPCDEAQNYLEQIKKEGLVVEDSEYLVSDNKHYASCIDKVFRKNETTFHLGDIKTTYKLDKEYVRWQLSICAYLFELQNAGAKVERLLGIWLRGDKVDFVDVERIPNEIIVHLLACDLAGTQFINPYALPEKEGNLPAKYQDMEQAILEIDEQAKFWADKKKELIEGVMKEMIAAGVYNWKGENIQFVRKKDSIRNDFDKKAFEKDHSDLYKKYLKETPVVGSVTLKIS
ncbi:MAG TPA: hypothetical protein DHW31_04640 [Bacteroides graminisolvens]|uniref:PD-(D/E)XK endonuclease-like domain-containing protein n=1 Tax=Bacteroides graminisolvens TaxID=477666 RepID=A0A3D2SDX9_9BACE|nr:hypothetical protein [uncultured Bacteroides sp.]HCK24064.1 hypothetical protein [Bacteroides graminisolvens]